MKKCFFLLFLVTEFAMLSKAQDTTFYDSKGKQVKSFKNAAMYKVVVQYRSPYVQRDIDKATEKIYTKSGMLLQDQKYSSYSNGIVDGEVKKWFENGRFRADIHYKNDTLVDSLVTYWKNGNIKRRDNYDNNGKLIRGICFDSNGRPIPHFDYRKMPVFDYYKGDLTTYFFSHIKYPRGADRRGIGGKVVVSFIVAMDGSVSHVTIKKSSENRDLDDASINVFTNMPLWQPGTEDGDPVRVTYVFPIKFDPGW